MKAAVHARYGPPEVVRISDAEKPTAKDNELLVKVHATTVNRTDCGFRSGKPFFSRFFTGLVRPRGTVMGNEFAGEVEAVGGGVTSFEVGDRVFGFTGLSGPFGAHADYVTIPEDGSVATMLPDLTYEEAAPSIEGSHYALSNASGEFKPLIDRRYQLDQIVEAYRYVETGQKIGNVVISIGPASTSLHDYA